METRTPTVTRILVAIGFAVSCFGLALFLWTAFGGPVPLKAQGYRIEVPFTEAAQLAEAADVRISGVSVGKVTNVEGSEDGRALAEIELDSRYAPLPRDTRAILRQKTLLGETYVELTPGSPSSGELPEGARLPVGQVSDAVQLDEVFRAFDERTRNAFRAWMQGSAAATKGRGEDLSIAIASLAPFADEAERALRLLDSQEVAVSRFVSQAGEVFAALAERQGQLRGLIRNADTVFATTARRNEELADAFTVLPTFLRESRTTLERLERFARDTDPVVTALRPAARELGPTAAQLAASSPELRAFFIALPALTAVAPRGSRALRALLDRDLPPLLGRLDGWLGPVNAVLETVRRYRREATSLANLAAASNGVLFDLRGGDTRHVRTLAPLTPEAVAAYPQRLRITRTNPYLRPGGFRNLRSALRSFETRHCAAGIDATVLPGTAASPLFRERLADPASDEEAQTFFDRLNLYAFNDQLGTAGIASPPCDAQAAVRSIGAPETSRYLHVRDLPNP
ncbi:MAG TPA: MlaD family protein [Solirubrobacterales bacterium]|jgi:virulence factor Mce-like protein